MKMDNPLITGTLFFPEEYFEDKNITQTEMEYGRFFFKNHSRNIMRFMNKMRKIIVNGKTYNKCNRKISFYPFYPIIYESP